jgi:hypothetical protein
MWLRTGRAEFLVVSGDNLIVTPDGVDLSHAVP